MFFRKIKIRVVSKEKEQGHVPVAKADARLPTPIEWQERTNGGRSSQHRLNAIYEQLRDYWAPSNGGWTRLALLGEIYFIADSWLRSADRYKHSTQQSHQEKYNYRRAAVEQLYVTTVNELCKAIECSVNVLPQALEEMFGRVLTDHGNKVDSQPGVARYLSRAQVERYRVVFDSGWAYMWDPSKPGKRALADSTAKTWEYGPYAPSTAGAMFEPGYAGFAMSMSRKLYMGNHAGGFDHNNFFHSSYLSGETVMCTGSIYIQNGQVVGLCNDSGHYQPTIEHLANVVQALSAEGVNPAQIFVRAVAHSWLDVNGHRGTYDLHLKGDQLLHMRGSAGRQLFNRTKMNEELIKQDRGGRMYTRVRTLPPVPVR